MSDRYTQLLTFVQDMQKDFEQFYGKGNKAAGTRIRKSLQDLKKLAQDVREEVQEKKKEA